MTAQLRAPGWYRGRRLRRSSACSSPLALVTVDPRRLRLPDAVDGDAGTRRWQDAILIVSLLAAPLFFLVGLGAFDYWFYWASGRPTRPEDHSSHGAHSLARLLPRQHRPQGDRHPVRRHLVLLHARRRPAGDGRARGARGAGHAVRGLERLQRAVQRPRVADDLPVHHPGLRGAGELRAAADDRRAGHGVPAPERAVVLDAAGRRH